MMGLNYYEIDVPGEQIRGKFLLRWDILYCDDVLNLEHQKIYQMIMFLNREKEKDVIKRMPHCRTTRWNDEGFDIINKDASKKRGIMEIQNFFQLNNDELMAFGDGENDMEMLQYCGTGIAMGNAPECVKAVADRVCESVDEDGVAKEIKRFLRKANAHNTIGFEK